jgi:hypothetical protein
MIWQWVRQTYLSVFINLLHVWAWRRIVDNALSNIDLLRLLPTY